MDLSFLSSAGRISSAVPFDSATVTALHARSGLGVSIHDREAWVSLFSTLLIHFTPSPLSKLEGVDEFKAKLGVVR